MSLFNSTRDSSWNLFVNRVTLLKLLATFQAPSVGCLSSSWLLTLCHLSCPSLLFASLCPERHWQESVCADGGRLACCPLFRVRPKETELTQWIYVWNSRLCSGLFWDSHALPIHLLTSAYRHLPLVFITTGPFQRLSFFTEATSPYLVTPSWPWPVCSGAVEIPY